MCVPSGSVDQNGSVNRAAAPKLAAEMVCCCCALVTKLADRVSSSSIIVRPHHLPVSPARLGSIFF